MPSEKQRIGAALEAAAEHLLIKHGYRMVERNLYIAGTELDRVAFDGKVLCFIEIRYRRSTRYGRPEASVGWGKRRHVIRAARAYLMRFASPPSCRFDVVALTRRPDGAADGTAWATIEVEDPSLGVSCTVEAELFQNAFDATGRTL
jgi:putative endonuclease